MSTESYIILTLSLVIIVREVLFQIALNRLLNKLMSRNYGEYEIGKRYKEALYPKKKAPETPGFYVDASVDAAEMGL